MAGAAQFTKDLKMNATGSVEVKKPTMSARLSIAAQHTHLILPLEHLHIRLALRTLQC